MEENKLYLYNQFAINNVQEDDNIIKVDGYCCHYNKINLNNEMVDEKSFDAFFELYNANKLKPNLNYNHTEQLIGGIDSITSMKDGLFMQAHINKDVAIVRDMIAPLIMSGDINSFSTEGWILNGYDGIVELNEGNAYYVKDFMLMGVAVVANPADWDAKFSIANYIKDLKKPVELPSKWYLL